MRYDNPQIPTPPEGELEAALSSLRPASPVLNRDALMFRAGQAAGLRKARGWQIATTTLGLMLACSLALYSTPSNTRIVYVEKSPPAVPAPQPSLPSNQAAPPVGEPTQFAYLAMRDDVLLHGVEALRPARPGAARIERLPELERLRSATAPVVRTGLLGTLENLFDAGVGS